LEEGISETALVETTESIPEETKKAVEQKDPAADRQFNVLIIGNSDSTGWPDELNHLFSSADITVNIYTVYYSGCSLLQHWHWLQNGQGFYRLHHHKQAGGVDDYEEVNLKYCLKQKNWDVISLQQEFGPVLAANYDEETFGSRTEPMAKNLYDYLKENLPKTKLVWFETWSYEIGWERNDKAVRNLDEQNRMYEIMKTFSYKIATDNKVSLIPCGDAWQIARHEYNSGDLSRDGYHDGPENGGQYLNACVWFESLTGISPVGNPWRPSSYEISEERILMLQEAAHKAVEQNTIK
jgi:hypothetical protein